MFETADNVKLFIGVVTDRQWQLFTAGLNEPGFDGRGCRLRIRCARGSLERLIPLVRDIIKTPAAMLENDVRKGRLPFARDANASRD